MVVEAKVTLFGARFITAACGEVWAEFDSARRHPLKFRALSYQAFTPRTSLWTRSPAKSRGIPIALIDERFMPVLHY